MPRYFFHLVGSPMPEDSLGTVCPGPEDARSQAVVAAGEMLRDIDGAFWDGPEWRMHVTDEEGATVCEIRISGRGPSA
ncbi:DUF6894 family protein [Rubellimicrobium aerolatum]|uniref:DUF6894 family protein n=1 Tax=Rubellimicrobium aerolatum TaxID=490979 RepID=A0ABW0SI27_9RHOB|nr:hypothetical protein [Rubellimicrobium aerolatum]MBP1807715.1 hypothetical protein [Rubellimicrobium aerolatum]